MAEISSQWESLSGTRKMIPDGNVGLQKVVECIGNGNKLGEDITSFLIWIYLKDSQLFKSNIVWILQHVKNVWQGSAQIRKGIKEM